jgi:hypothetical protein
VNNTCEQKAFLQHVAKEMYHHIPSLASAKYNVGNAALQFSDTMYPFSIEGKILAVAYVSTVHNPYAQHIVSKEALDRPRAASAHLNLLLELDSNYIQEPKEEVYKEIRTVAFLDKETNASLQPYR